jgi:AcrR family transcriptional regulator
MATTRIGERRRRSDGERSRRTILQAAARLATVEGLDGLSIGQLASHIGMSKSGLYAHFGSKLELQLAIIDTAQEIFEQDVLAPAARAGTGLARARALCERFLAHVEREVFPGGCFFASVATELDTRPGPVRDRVAGVHRAWSEEMAGALREAQAGGDLDPGTDIDLLTFELNAMLGQANATWVLHGDPRVFDWARRGVTRLLDGGQPRGLSSSAFPS